MEERQVEIGMLVEMSTQAGVSLLHHLTAVHEGIDILHVKSGLTVIPMVNDGAHLVSTSTPNSNGGRNVLIIVEVNPSLIL